VFAEGLNEKVCLECNRQFTGIVAACPHDGSMLVNKVQDPLIGTTLAGHYEIISLIGHGGMGVVYKARHNLMDRIVAIKMLHANLVSDSMSVKRFQQESKAASRISHPHVITVYDFGISPQGQPYIVMDYLEGISLADVIKNEGQVSVERCIKIISQACDALEHAHRQGVVHRDLKPTNIVLVETDEDKDFVKVVDFGVAKLMSDSTEGQRLTQAGEVCGSPVYMSPEQCLGQELDARSDIYSMGICMYESLTGKLPIVGKTMVDTMSKHISEMPPTFKDSRPDLYIPERLESVVMRALSKTCEDRQQSMDELKVEIDMAIPRPGRSQVLRTAPVTPVDPKQLVKTLFEAVSVKVWAAVACAVVVVGIILFMVMQPKPAVKPEQATVPVTNPPKQTSSATTPATTAASPTHPETKPAVSVSTAAAPSTAPVATTKESDKTKESPVAPPTPPVKAAAKPHVKPHSTVTADEPGHKASHRRAYSSYGAAASPEDIIEATVGAKRHKPTSSNWDELKNSRSY
jgi:serine/threonine-protein kinase